jgi:peptidoglycan/xylan/chitin deacetylase (PgdA/CDA1 family)
LKAIALAYHDVFEGESFEDEGARHHAAHYALSRAEFRKHLESIRPRPAGSEVATIGGIREWQNQTPVFLTFDDGALGSLTCAADELEKKNWRGHFFIISSWIGQAGFMDARQIRELAGRGHVIGSHSCSHPERMANLAWNDLVGEWKESCAVIGDVLGEKVKVASVPNGYYSRAVAESAAEAGIEILFNSEPTQATTLVDGCLVIGRYSILGGDTPALTRRLTSERWPRWRQKLLWDAKKAAKIAGGPAYLALRTMLLKRGSAAAVKPGSRPAE